MSTRRRVARFNRLVANRFVGPVLTRLPGFGTIHHQGRKSRREYQTPVKLFRRGNEFVITLPYGRDSDWVKNVLAAGGCDLVTCGHCVRLVRPTLFVDDGRVAIPVLIRMALAWINATEFLALTPAEPFPAAKK